MNKTLASQAAAIALWEANLAILNSTPKPPPIWAVAAKPYLKAISYNDYGLEDPKVCVLYALCNLHTWRGPTARKIKADLNEAIK